MKKKLVNYAFMAGLIMSCTSFITVNASDLSNKIQTNVNDIFGTGAAVKSSYDEGNDVNNVAVTLTVDEGTIDKLLSQRPGVDPSSSLSIAYYKIDPNVAFGKMYKENNFFLVSDSTSIEDMKKNVRARVGSDDLTSLEDTWAAGALIQYSLDNGATWKTTTTKPDGKVSVGENLLKDLGLSSLDELVYGENYRISMWDKYNWLFLWADSEDKTNEEWIHVSYKLEYPVAVDAGETIAYYPSINAAIASGSKDITVNKNLSVSSDIVVPEGVKLTVSEGVVITLEDDVDIRVDGTIINEGTIVDSKNNKYVTITVASDVSVSKYFAKAGETIKVVYEEKEGYEAQVLYLNKEDNEYTEVKDGSFVVPSSDVYVTVNYKRIPIAFKDLENSTYDGKGDLVFTVTGEFELFDKIYINGKEVDSKYYTVQKGSTIITLKKEYLSDLSNGDYTLKVTYTNGDEATTTFNVLVKPNEDKNEEKIENPKTLDNISMFIATAVVSIFGICASALYLKKSKYNK